MNQADIWSTASAVLLSLGGGGAIVWGLSSFLGNLWSKKLIAKYQLDLDEKFEKIKKEYTTEVETYKSELEKARNDYYRFSSKKFEIIEQTWSAIFDITEELKIYNKNEDNYSEYLKSSIQTINKYTKIIQKNSLYFNEEITKLLNSYILMSSELTANASKKIIELDTPNKFQEIINDISEASQKRELLRDDIKNKFKDEFGGVC
jgi:hypothetical protein